MGEPNRTWAVRELSPDELRKWSREARPTGQGMRDDEGVARRRGYLPVRRQPNGLFSWLCPGCWCFASGNIGDAPVSGWDEPRWTWDGEGDQVTLAPSLGCPRWRTGECVGHWWLRDGRLVLA